MAQQNNDFRSEVSGFLAFLWACFTASIAFNFVVETLGLGDLIGLLAGLAGFVLGFMSIAIIPSIWEWITQPKTQLPMPTEDPWEILRTVGYIFLLGMGTGIMVIAIVIVVSVVGIAIGIALDGN